MDRLDAWNVLSRLRNDDCFSNVPTDMPHDDSIDAAVEQPIMRMREHFHGKVPSWAKRRPPVDRDSPRPMVTLLPSGEMPSNEEEFKRMERKVWDFAAGLELRWKRAPRTPAGRQCEVLTFSGSDEVLVTPTGLQLPSNRK